MEKTFTPKVCTDHKETINDVETDVSASFKGQIKVKLMSFPERCRLPQKLGLQELQAEKASEEDKKAKLMAQMANLEFMAKAAEEIKANILAVELEELGTNQKITSVEELYCYETTGPIVMELVSKFVFGFAEKK